MDSYLGGMSMTVVKPRPNSLCLMLDRRHIFTKVNNRNCHFNNVFSYFHVTLGHMSMLHLDWKQFLRLFRYLSKQYATYLNIPPFFGPFCLFWCCFLEAPGRWALNFCEPWAIFANRKYTECFFFCFSFTCSFIRVCCFTATYWFLRDWLEKYTKKLNNQFHCGFYCFYCIDVKEKSLNPWLHVTELYSYTFILKKVLNYFYFTKLNKDQVIINNNSNILALKEAIWTTLLPL